MKTNRAREILEQVKSAREEACGSAFLKADIVAEGDWQVARLRLLSPTPDRLSCIVGDVIHNLRSALDHLACLMVEYSGSAVTRWTQFPVSESSDKFEEHCKRQLAGVATEFQQFVQSHQPFSDSATQPNRLEAIHRLDIKDKHRNLLLAAVLPYSINFGARGRDGAIPEIKMNEGLPFPLVDGVELLRFRLREDVRLEQLSVTLQLGADIALAEGGPESGQPLIPVLYELIKYVEEEVLFASEGLVVTAPSN